MPSPSYSSLPGEGQEHPTGLRRPDHSPQTGQHFRHWREREQVRARCSVDISAPYSPLLCITVPGALCNAWCGAHCCRLALCNVCPTPKRSSSILSAIVKIHWIQDHWLKQFLISNGAWRQTVNRFKFTEIYSVLKFELLLQVIPGRWCKNLLGLLPSSVRAHKHLYLIPSIHPLWMVIWIE